MKMCLQCFAIKELDQFSGRAARCRTCAFYNKAPSVRLAVADHRCEDMASAERALAARPERARDVTQRRLRSALRSRVYHAAKGLCTAGSAVEDLGCSVAFLRKRLEDLFQDGMSWSNWSPEGWHIDHIRPLAMFDLTNREQFLEACHYTNLQPMWATDNIKKGARYVG